MELPSPQGTVLALAAFIRQRLADVSSGLAPIWAQGGRLGERLPAQTEAAARQVAMVIVGAAAPFAPTSYARARLLRQMYASGLLSEREAQQADRLLEIAQ